MTHATKHNTNTPRRAHPAAVRAALRSRNVHRFEYDRLDRMVKEIRPLGQAIRYPDGSTVENQYTPGTDNLTQHTDENGATTQYE